MWALWHVAAQPEWRARLRASGVHGEDTDRFVSEVLRLDQSEFVMRRATAPIDHEGPAGRIVVPAEWYVRVCTREIHRDDRGFADPARFDPDRFAVEGGVGNSRAVYAPFGIDHHACLGERLTRTFAQSFVFEAAHWELRTVTDGPTEMSRARHWAPSTRWRLAVTAPAEVP
ncbi:MAG: cytochrome P450 [Acidimicrobiia bacterium]